MSPPPASPLLENPPPSGLEHAGRSSLRTAWAPYRTRRRRYVWRWLLLALLAGAAGGLGWAVAVRALAADGPFRAVYFLHDAVYLPVRGALWTAPFPHGLTWAVPAVAAAALLLVEALLPWNPLRALHRLAILSLLRTGWGRAVIAWPLRLGWPWLAGFSRMVVDERFSALWSAARAAMEAGGRPGREVWGELWDIAMLRHRLRLADHGGRLGLLEVALLTDLDAAAAGEATRRPDLPPRAAETEAVLVPWLAAAGGAGEPSSARSTLHQMILGFATTLETAIGSDRRPADWSPMLCAAAVLAAVRAARVHHLGAAKTFFDAWARARGAAGPPAGGSNRLAAGPPAGGSNGLAACLAAAETLVDFELWAAMAEHAAAPALPGALLAEALDGAALGLLRGEAFAVNGVVAAGGRP